MLRISVLFVLFFVGCHNEVKISLEQGGQNRQHSLRYEGGTAVVSDSMVRMILRFGRSGTPFVTDTGERLRLYIYGEKRCFTGGLPTDDVKAFYVRVQLFGNYSCLRAKEISIANLERGDLLVSGKLISDTLCQAVRAEDRVTAITFDRLSVNRVFSDSELLKHETEYEQEKRETLAPDW